MRITRIDFFDERDDVCFEGGIEGICDDAFAEVRDKRKVFFEIRISENALNCFATHDHVD